MATIPNIFLSMVQKCGLVRGMNSKSEQKMTIMGLLNKREQNAWWPQANVQASRGMTRRAWGPHEYIPTLISEFDHWNALLIRLSPKYVSITISDDTTWVAVSTPEVKKSNDMYTSNPLTPVITTVYNIHFYLALLPLQIDAAYTNSINKTRPGSLQCPVNQPLVGDLTPGLSCLSSLSACCS